MRSPSTLSLRSSAFDGSDDATRTSFSESGNLGEEAALPEVDAQHGRLRIPHQHRRPEDGAVSPHGDDEVHVHLAEVGVSLGHVEGEGNLCLHPHIHAPGDEVIDDGPGYGKGLGQIPPRHDADLQSSPHQGITSKI